MLALICSAIHHVNFSTFSLVFRVHEVRFLDSCRACLLSGVLPQLKQYSKSLILAVLRVEVFCDILKPKAGGHNNIQYSKPLILFTVGILTITLNSSFNLLKHAQFPNVNFLKILHVANFNRSMP